MSRIALFCAGLCLACSMSGCCLMHGFGGYPGGGYYGGGGCSPCNTGCGVGYAPNGYPSAGMYGPGMPATAFAPAATTAQYAPGYYPQLAMGPLDPLPSY